MPILLGRREIPRVELALQVLATDVVDRVDSATDYILIHETGLSELQKTPVDVLALINETIVPRDTDRRLRPLIVQILQYSIVSDNHPSRGEAQSHTLPVYRRVIICQVPYTRLLGKCIHDNVKIELSTRDIDLNTGTGPVGEVARRFEKRTGEDLALLCDGSGETSAETMLNTNLPGKSSTDRGIDR